MLGAGAISGITKITDVFKNLVPAVNAVTGKIPVLGEKLQIVQQQATGFDAVFDGILHGIASHPGLWGAAAVAIRVTFTGFSTIATIVTCSRGDPCCCS